MDDVDQVSDQKHSKLGALHKALFEVTLKPFTLSVFEVFKIVY